MRDLRIEFRTSLLFLAAAAGQWYLATAHAQSCFPESLSWQAPTTYLPCSADDGPGCGEPYSEQYGLLAGYFLYMVDQRDQALVTEFIPVPTQSADVCLPMGDWTFFATAVLDNTLESPPSGTISREYGTDTDGDLFYDDVDNCRWTVNVEQCDTDFDGYGNHCDADFNQNGIVDPYDFSLLKSCFGQTDCPDIDLDCDGRVDPADFSRLKSMFGQPVGASETPAAPTSVNFSGPNARQL